jgi:hypothetical protein
MLVKLSVKRIRCTADRAGIRASSLPIARYEVTNMCRKVMNQAVIDCPVDTGNLRAHHFLRVRDLRTSVKGSVVNNAKYAAAVHDGTKPHTIRARRKKALRFTIGDETIFVRSVRHPGTKARPWLYEALRVAASKGWKVQRTQQTE